MAEPCSWRPSPGKLPEVARKPGCWAGLRVWVPGPEPHPAYPSTSLERPRGSAFNFALKNKRMMSLGVGGWGCFFLLFLLSHFMGIGHGAPFFSLGVSFGLVSPSCLWPFLPLAAASLPRVPLWLPSQSVLLSCRPGAPPEGSSPRRAFSLPVSATLSLSLPLPRPFPDSGPSHLRGKVNI